MTYYLDKKSPQLGGYDIEESDQGFRWTWAEWADEERYEDFGAWLPTRAEALRAAAADWEESGSHGMNPRYLGTLRALASRAS